MRWSRAFALSLLLLPTGAAAQVAPAVFTTVRTTDLTAISLCVGCPLGTTVPSANSGARLATLTIDPYAAPAITTNTLYNVAGALSWNGVTLATGSTISGTTNTIGLFTGVAAMGNSLLTQSGTTVTMAGTLAATNHTGSGAGLTGIPTTALTGNYVATVGSGTGVTSSVPTGAGAATTVSLNNTAVVPSTYPFFTVDQQGRLTGATATTPLTLTSTATGSTALNQFGTIAIQPFAVNNQWISDNIYYDGTGFKYTAAGGGVLLYFGQGTPGNLSIWTAPAGPANATATVTPRLSISESGNVSLGPSLTDAVATPTIASGFGTGATIAGKDYAFVVTPASTALAGGVVNFNATYANPPVCVASAPGRSSPVVVSTTTTQATFTTNPGDLGVAMHVLCRGY